MMQQSAAVCHAKSIFECSFIMTQPTTYSAVMYQIFPDRFARSGATPIESGKWLHENWDDCPEYRPDKYGKILNNDFFGGNFRGMTEKIGYLKSLHITVVYLNPIFKAFSNHRYDTGD